MTLKLKHMDKEPTCQVGGVPGFQTEGQNGTWPEIAGVAGQEERKDLLVLGWQQGARSFRTLWTVSGVLIFALPSQQPLEQDPPGRFVAELFLKGPSDLHMESVYEEQEAGGTSGRRFLQGPSKK